MSDRSEKRKALSHAKYERDRKIRAKKGNDDAAAWNKKQKDNAREAKKIVKAADLKRQQAMNRRQDRKSSNRAGGLF